MNKEEILKISQKENEGKPDEYEVTVYDKASRTGMTVGAILCIILVFISRYVAKMPELAFAGLIIYFSMHGSSDLILYTKLTTRSKLISSIVCIIFAVASIVALTIMMV